MDAEFAGLAVDPVGFHAGHVVGDVVNLEDLMIGHLPGQGLFEAAANRMGQHLTIGEGIVGGRGHGGQVLPAFGAAEGGADQLPVRQVQAIGVKGFLKAFHVIRADLVAQAPRAAVNLNDDAIRNKPHAIGGAGIEHLCHGVHLDKMVAGAQGADLVLAPFKGPLTDTAGIGAGQTAVAFGPFQIAFGRHSAFERPAGAAYQDLSEFLGF